MFPERESGGLEETLANIQQEILELEESQHFQNLYILPRDARGKSTHRNA